MNFEDLMNYEYAHDSWIQSILTMIKTSQQQHKKIMLTECEIWNNWLFYQENLIVLNSELLWFKILEFVYDVTVAEHSDHAKTYEIIQWVYYWFIMHDFVQKYVWFCSTCAQEKSWHTKKQDVLWFLFVFYLHDIFVMLECKAFYFIANQLIYSFDQQNYSYQSAKIVLSWNCVYWF